MEKLKVDESVDIADPQSDQQLAAKPEPQEASLDQSQILS